MVISKLPNTVSVQDRLVEAARKLSFNWCWYRWLPTLGTFSRTPVGDVFLRLAALSEPPVLGGPLHTEPVEVPALAVVSCLF